MAQEPSQPAEPRGFGERTRGLAGEYAHEQGWGLNEEERTHQSAAPQDVDGGNDYEYGARDFGDAPVNVSIDRDASERPASEGVTTHSGAPAETTNDEGDR